MIFDLDDTLIETSLCITPHVLKRAFDRMQQAGLGAEERAIEKLLAINEKALTSREALESFTRSFPDRKKFFDIGLEALALPLEENLFIDAVPFALETLDRLGKEHTLALVTKGEAIVQYQKMEKAGIQRERFSKLIVSRGQTKKEDYQIILSDLGYHPDQGIVCGDRIVFDLAPAKEMGLYTVHFRNGRGKFHSNPQESVDVTIDCLTELQEVLAKHEG